MRIYNSFLVIPFFALGTCNAMENNKKLPLTEITTVTNPRCVQYLDKDRVVIAGESGCDIVDLNTNTVIKKLNNFNYNDSKKSSHMKVPFNKNRIITFYDNEIRGYNAQTGEQEWSNTDHYLRYFACDKTGDTIIAVRLGTGIVEYTYGKKTSTIPDHDIGFYSAAMHPTQKEMCISKYPMPIYLCSFDDSLVGIKKIFNNGGYKVEYSLDGSCILGYDASTLFFIDPTIDGEKYPQVKCGEKEDMRAGISFYPHESIVATISTESSKRITLVRYYDAKNQQLIESELHNTRHPHQLAFSGDGLEYIMAIEDKCIRGNVPFKVRWHNKPHLLLAFLKKYLNKHPEIIVPSDIVYYVWHHFLL
jgi:hypothetical protein